MTAAVGWGGVVLVGLSALSQLDVTEDEVSQGGVPEVAGTSSSASGLEELRKALAEQARRLALLEEEVRAAEELLVDNGTMEETALSRLRFYGFFETGLQRMWVQDDSSLNGFLQTPELSFILGDLHLYLDVMPFPAWRALFELRVNTSSGRDQFSLGGYTLLSNAEARLNRPGIGLGGAQVTSSLVLERAWIEHTLTDAFGVRLGLWLLPFGIWNVDHGAPTLIATHEPYFTGFQAFPTHQVGMAVFGRFHALPWQLRYHLGVSNGRISGPAVPGQWANFDFTDDKMLSGRIEASRRDAESLTIGVSGYWGTTTRPDKAFVAAEPRRLEVTTGQQLDEWGVGADLSYDAERFKARVEAAYIEHRWPVGRPNATFYVLRDLPDSSLASLYALFAFPFPFEGLRLEPYLTLEGVYWPAVIAPSDYGLAPSIGFNVHFAPSVQLKTQLGWYGFFDRIGDRIEFRTDDQLFSASLRLVVSF